MLRHWYFRLFAILIAIWGLGLCASAESKARIVRLSQIEGKVQLDRGDGSGFQQAFVNMPVSEGTRLQTASDGKAEIQFEDGSNIRLVPDTTISFPQLALKENGGKLTTIDFGGGEAYFNFHKHDKDEFALNAWHLQIKLEEGSSFRISLDNAANVAVLNGEVKVSGEGVTVAVKKNQTLSFGDQGEYQLAKRISAEPYDSWNHDRDEYTNSYAGSNYGVYSPYSYGYSDLANYGTFFATPYGTCWRPYYASAYWNPFADGAWVFYPGMGYSWVSAYQWGWLPYHYGSWIFLQPYGWVWQPGLWNAWAPRPIIVNPPSGFRGPTPPPHHGGAGIVTVGHGPSVGPHGPGSAGGQVGLGGELGGRGREGAGASGLVGRGAEIPGGATTPHPQAGATNSAGAQQQGNAGAPRSGPTPRIEPTPRGPANSPRIEPSPRGPVNSPRMEPAPRTTPAPRSVTPPATVPHFGSQMMGGPTFSGPSFHAATASAPRASRPH